MDFRTDKRPYDHGNKIAIFSENIRRRQNPKRSQHVQISLVFYSGQDFSFYNQRLPSTMWKTPPKSFLSPFRSKYIIFCTWIKLRIFSMLVRTSHWKEKCKINLYTNFLCVQLLFTLLYFKMMIFSESFTHRKILTEFIMCTFLCSFILI